MAHFSTNPVSYVYHFFQWPLIIEIATFLWIISKFHPGHTSLILETVTIISGVPRTEGREKQIPKNIRQVTDQFLHDKIQLISNTIRKVKCTSFIIFPIVFFNFIVFLFIFTVSNFFDALCYCHDFYIWIIVFGSSFGILWRFIYRVSYLAFQIFSL